MGLPRSNDGEARFSAYVEGLTSVIGHADRAKPLRDYCLGLMMPCERKSVEPIIAFAAGWAIPQGKARIAGGPEQVDTFKMMTTGKQLPSEHFADYSFVFN